MLDLAFATGGRDRFLVCATPVKEKHGDKEELFIPGLEVTKGM